MIYKNGIRVNRIELIINETQNTVICRSQLSNGKVYTGQPKKVDPEIIHNKKRLEEFALLTIAKTIQCLNEEMENG